jgi:tetratricopeptide (TPR) repeat protein
MCIGGVFLLYSIQGEKEEAMFFYDQALTILKRVHGESHPQVQYLYVYLIMLLLTLCLLFSLKVVVTLDNLASLLDDMGMRKEALEVEDQADAIAEKLMADEKAMKERASSIHTSSTVAASSRRPRSTRSLHSIGMGSLPVDDLLDEDDQLSQRRTGCTIM